MSDTEAFINWIEKRALQMEKPLKVGDLVRHSSGKTGTILKLFARIQVVNSEEDFGPDIFVFPFEELTKTESKVKRWKWVLQNNGIVSLTLLHYTEKEVEAAIDGCEGWGVLQKIDATERIDDE